MGEWFCRLMTLFTLIICSVPTGMSAFSGSFPMVGAVIIFFFYLHFSNVLNYLTVITLFLLHDILFGIPLALSLCGYAMMYAALVKTSHFLTSYDMANLWKYFTFYSLIPVITQWAIMVFVNNQWLLVLEAALFQWLFTIVTFPLFYSVFVLLSLPCKEVMHYAE